MLDFWYFSRYSEFCKQGGIAHYDPIDLECMRGRSIFSQILLTD